MTDLDLKQFDDWFTRAFGQPPILPEEMADVRKQHQDGKSSFERNAQAVRWDHDRQVDASTYVGDPEALKRCFAEFERVRGPRPVNPGDQQAVDGAIQRGRLATVVLNRQEDWNRMRTWALAGWRAARVHSPA